MFDKRVSKFRKMDSVIVFLCAIVIILGGIYGYRKGSEKDSEEVEERKPLHTEEISEEKIMKEEVSEEEIGKEDQIEAGSMTYEKWSKVVSSVKMGGKLDYTKINVPVEGMDDADIVKTDGEYLYVLSVDKIYIVDTKNGLKTIGSIMINEDDDTDENNSYYIEMCIKDQQLILFEQVGWKYYYDLSYTDEYDEEKSKATTNVIIYNIEDKEKPVFEKKIEQSGCYKSAKVKDDYLYFFTDYTTYRSNVPKVGGEEFNDTDECVILKEGFSESLIASVIHLKEKKVTDKIMIESGSGLLHVNENRIYSIVSVYKDGEGVSGIVELDYHEDKIDYIGVTKIDGYLNDQTDMDEMIGACRFLRSYGDGMLLGIGYDLDEESGDRKSVRLTMFDIKDPTKIEEIASIELSDCNYFAEEENMVFVSENKNLIGICTNGSGRAACFYSISFEQGEFLINAKEEMDSTEFTRGIDIEDMIYVVSREQIKAISLKDGSLIETLEFPMEY